MASLKKKVTVGICQQFIIQHSQLFQIRNVYENLTFKLAINNQYCDLA
jgi:ABC-type methionine transport system ATPase subunit